MRFLAELSPGKKVLDAGCGRGAFTGRLAKVGHEVFGFDLSKPGIEIAKNQYPDIRFEVASVYDDFETLFGCTFDSIVSLEVIEHLQDPRCFVRNVKNALSPGGIFIVTTPYHGYLKNLLLAITGGMDRHFGALWDGGHIKFWSRRSLSLLLSEAGFDLVAFRGAGRLPYIWKSMIMVAQRGCTPSLTREDRA